MTTADRAPDAATSAFPVRWERPEDEQVSWAQDRMAFPEPIAPLEASYAEEVYSAVERSAAR